MARSLVYFAVVTVLSAPIVHQSGDKPLAFEIADIHPSTPGTNILNQIMRGPYIAGGRFELQGATLLDIIRIAYSPAIAGLDSLGRRIDQLDADKVVGGPSGLDFNRFDVIAKAPPHSSLGSMKIMLQTLLANRFKLAIHTGSVPLPAYALTAGRKPLLKEADGSEESGCKQSPYIPGPGSMVSYSCRNMTMAAFADGMRSMGFANLNNNRVVDQTGLNGSWNFDFKYSVPAALSGTAPGDIVSLSDAVQKQLGLDLVLTKVPTPVLIVDRANDNPTPNPPGLAKALPPLPEEFEVAAVKPTSPDFSASTPFKGGRIELQPGGRVVIQNATLRRLIVRAWGLPPVSDQILLGPKFMDTDKFDIIAKAPVFGPPPDEPATVPTIAGPLPSSLLYQYTNADSIDPMLRTLLVKRFGLTFHNEERPLPSLTLSSVKAKLQKADPAHRTGCHSAAGPAGTALPTRILSCENITMAQFAARLPLYVIGTARLPTDSVVDATGLNGAWDFTLTYSASSGANPFAGDAANGGRGLQDTEPGGMNLVEAMGKQLGLKLELTKRPGKVMLIDHLEEKPKEP